MSEKIILAYSGGLDTSVAIKWIQENYGYEVVTLTADLGNVSDLPAIKQRAIDVGAVAAIVAAFYGAQAISKVQSNGKK